MSNFWSNRSRAADQFCWNSLFGDLWGIVHHPRALEQFAGKAGGSLQIHAQKFTGLPIYEIIDEFVHEKLKASALLLVQLAASLLSSCLQVVLEIHSMPYSNFVGADFWFCGSAILGVIPSWMSSWAVYDWGGILGGITPRVSVATSSCPTQNMLFLNWQIDDWTKTQLNQIASNRYQISKPKFLKISKKRWLVEWTYDIVKLDSYCISYEVIASV